MPVMRLALPVVNWWTDDIIGEPVVPFGGVASGAIWGDPNEVVFDLKVTGT